MRSPRRAPDPGRAKGGPTAASAQAMARYLVGLRPILADACIERNKWVRQIGGLLDQARTGSVLRVARGAGQLGREFSESFRQIRARIESLNPPPECDVCHAAVRAWVEALLGSSETMLEIGRSGNLSILSQSQEHLVEARVQARRFNDEYSRLANELRRRVATARRQMGTAGRSAAG
ncbi:MAG: hypothetical protein EPO26_17985 [Chloroflexota bacterium]|nr:MAG: hypothetical protein EPO26_17985 [Chloroflexota bacterium]